MNCYFLCPSHREASWYVSGGSPEWRRRPLPPPVLFDVCSSKLIRFFWWLPSESSLDSFPHVQAYYFAVGAGSPSSSRIRLFLSLEEPEEAAEAEEHRPYVDEVEEGALSLRKDDRCYHFLLYSTVRESETFDVGELKWQDDILLRKRNNLWWFFYKLHPLRQRMEQ